MVWNVIGWFVALLVMVGAAALTWVFGPKVALIWSGSSLALLCVFFASARAPFTGVIDGFNKARLLNKMNSARWRPGFIMTWSVGLPVTFIFMSMMNLMSYPMQREQVRMQAMIHGVGPMGILFWSARWWFALFIQVVIAFLLAMVFMSIFSSMYLFMKGLL